jgi:hypothetical protein
MSATTAAHDHLTELTDELACILQDARHAASIRNAQMHTANASAEFRQFINDSAIKAADNPATGTEPCK